MASTLNVITAAAFAFVTLVPSQRGAGTGLPGVSGADVLTGRVSDADGHPVPGAFVSALFPAASGRRFSSEPTEFATLTGQLGEFRLEGLGSREFYVIAIPRGAVPPPVDGRGSAITYYPSALTIDEAKVLRLTPARLTHLDIVLRPARLSAVSGRVLTSNGELVRGGTHDNPGPQVIGNVRPDWTFQFYTWPGIGRVRVEIRTIDPPPLKVAAVRLNGVDVMNKDITFTQDQHLDGLEVALIRR